MRYIKLNSLFFPFLFFFVSTSIYPIPPGTPQRAPIRYTEIPNYEDSVRIAIVYNIARGSNIFGYCPGPNPTGIGTHTCPANTQNVGTTMLDYVLTALDPTDIPNIVVATSDTVTWSSVESWWPGKLPHVIVHLNAGWYTCNGDSIPAVLAKAADKAIGIVSIGDDAAHFSNAFFGFDSVLNSQGPQWGGTDPNLDLWIDLETSSDSLSNPGVIRNAAGSLLSTSKLNIKQYGGNGRCEADADVYTVGPSYTSLITSLGYQRGNRKGVDYSDPYGTPSAYNSINTLQDEQRRAVILAFQPQYIVEEEAVAQILYDGIFYASFAHFYNRKLKRMHIMR